MAEMRPDTRALPATWAAPQGSGGEPGAMDEEKATPASREVVAGQNEAPRSLRQQYPLNMTVDFTKLRANALRRYMAFHGIQEIPGSCRDQLAIVVARHFSEQCKLADEETSIASFLTYIKRGHVQLATSESDSQSDSSDGSEVQRGGPYDQDARFGQRTFSMDGAHENADTDNNSSTSSSEEDEDDDDPMGDTTPVKKVKRSRPSSSSSKKDRSKSKPSSSSSSSSASNNSKLNKNKKQRKTRLYCVCKGSSFGNMIACDNKKCSDRSNWYHMACVDLDPSKDPPETWYCPSCQEVDAEDLPENQYRKPVASVTYGDMISHALTALPEGKGSFKEICDFVEKEYESQLNWKLESDQRKSPVWKSSVRKILFSNMRFRKHPDDKGLFCLAA